jgi:hypothetical protein
LPWTYIHHPRPSQIGLQFYSIISSARASSAVLVLGCRLLQCDYERVPLAAKTTSGASAPIPYFAKAVWIATGPAVIDLQVAAKGPTQLPHTLLESGEAMLSFRIVRGKVRQHADAAHALPRLPAARERPRNGDAAEQR